MGGVRKIDSETGSGSLLISAILLHTFYIQLYTIPFIPNQDPTPAFSQKFKSGSEKCSRTPDPCPSLVYTILPCYRVFPNCTF